MLHKILFLEPNLDEIEGVTSALTEEGYRVIKTKKSDEALALIKKERPHLIISELLLKGTDGIDLCLKIREDNNISKAGFIIYTSRNDNYSQIAAYNAGVDDYILKGISPRVFTSKVKVITRRLGGFKENYEIPGLKIDQENFMVIKHGDEIQLLKKEFEILALLISRPNKVFTRDQIIKEVWNNDVEARSRTIDVHIRKLRKKIGENLIVTIKGVGYKLQAKV